MRISKGLTLASTLMLGLAATSGAMAQSAEDFYKGKTMTVLVGAPAGGGYSLAAQIISRHLGKHIPGNPDFQPNFMAGGGGGKAANYLYNAAPKDGSWIGVPIPSIVAGQKLYPDTARYD
ncbi:MAG: hypothetical protein AB7P12_18095, partial [Alphaproteobacteria bacterium]